MTLLGAPRAARAEEPAAADLPVRHRRWEVHGTAGFLYDSNVTLDPSGQEVPGAVDDPADGAFLVDVGGSVDLVDTDRVELSLEYDFYQTLHFRLDDYDLRGNRVQGTAGVSLLPQLWAGVQGGFQHWALGGDAYSGEGYVAPFVSLIEADWGLAQLVYRHGEVTYLSRPFEDVRDGPTDAASVVQTIYWDGGAVSAGYEFGSERPTASTGDDYRDRYHQAYAGVELAPGWDVGVQLMYVFRYEDYTEPNTFADDRARRRDHVNQLHAAVVRPLAPHLSVALAYYGTFDDSNIPVFEYDRHVVQAVLRVSY